MRIVAGEWRGRALVAPPGQGTRPTADRVRQALFDMLMHADWGGREAIEGAVVLDVFAGTGALGLEALSRGAASACFIENDPAALRALRANIATCKAVNRTAVQAFDVLKIGPAHSSQAVLAGLVPAIRPSIVRAQMGGTGPVMTVRAGVDEPASLIFLDPPYGQDLVPRALSRLRDVGRIRPDALIIAETGRDETWVPEPPILAERQHGAARILIFRAN